jgi:hypothetical protein
VKEQPIPADQFARTKEELRKLSNLVDMIQSSIDVTASLETVEARRALVKASDDIETAGFWLGKAIKALTPKDHRGQAL